MLDALGPLGAPGSLPDPARPSRGVIRKVQGTPVLIWNERRSAANPDDEDDDERRPRFYATIKNVFNVSQADGLDLEDPQPDVAEPPPPGMVDRVAADAHVRIVHMRGDRACYSPSTDTITIPERSQFHVPTAYEHTLLHELAHCTSHPSRLDRSCHRNTERGSTEYAVEELRAEIAAMMLGERLQIGHEPRHGQSCVSSWIKALDNDPDAVRKAAADSEDIANWLTRNISAETEQLAA